MRAPCLDRHETKMLRLFVLTIVAVAASAVEKRFFFFGSGEDSLDKYNVDKSQISVSGISSGAVMATQFHVIFSEHIMGAGLIAGVPFGCSGGNLAGATVCMKTPVLISLPLIETLTAGASTTHTIDHTSNLANDRVYIFSGRVDSVVNPGAGPKIESFYSHYIHNANNIKTVFNKVAEHGQEVYMIFTDLRKVMFTDAEGGGEHHFSRPTEGYGGPCDHLNTPDFLSNCNYSAAYDLLNHIYNGNLRKPSRSTVASGVLKKIDQTEFVYLSSPSLYSIDDVGYVYIPSGCADKTTSCKLHIAFHGCKMGQSIIGDHYVRHAGYNEVGELNNIIILYPQVIIIPTNLPGCWDWFGYTGFGFESNLGFQPTMLKRMMDRVTG